MLKKQKCLKMFVSTECFRHHLGCLYYVTNVQFLLRNFSIFVYLIKCMFIALLMFQSMNESDRRNLLGILFDPLTNDREIVSYLELFLFNVSQVLKLVTTKKQFESVICPCLSVHLMLWLLSTTNIFTVSRTIYRQFLVQQHSYSPPQYTLS